MNTLVWNLPLKDFFFLIQLLLCLFSINDRINSTNETRDSLGDYKKEKNKQAKNKKIRSCPSLDHCRQYTYLSGQSSQRVVK